MKKTIFLLFILSLLHCFTFAQNSTMDSLNLALKSAKQDTAKVKIYFALCNQCEIKDNLKYATPLIKLLDRLIAESTNDKTKKQFLEQKADAYGFVRYFYIDQKDTINIVETQKKRIAIYEEANDKEAIIGQIRGLSNYYMTIGNYPEGITYCQKALSKAKEMNYKKGVAGCLYQIAEIYRSQGENIQALENYQQSITIYSELKDTLGLADVLVSEGLYYSEFHNVKKAMESYNKSISLYEIKKIKRGVRKVYECISGMYLESKDFPKAMVYINKCLSMSEEMKDIYWIGLSLKSIGNIYSQQGYFEKALTNIIEALKKFKNIKDQTQIGWSYYCLADTYFKLKNYSKAKLYIDSALVMEKHQAFIENIKGGELLATKIDSARGDNKGAFEHYKQYIFLSNKLKSEEVHQLAQKEKYQSEYEKQKAIDKTISDNEIEKQKIVRNSSVGGFALMILLAGVSYRNFRRKKKDNLIIINQKHILEEKQKEILDSIEYALRIQTAILPPQKIVKQYLENSFILYKPKDIVAGDFYWMETVNDLVLFAACDCTGHGVPGAMVSVVCHNALNRVVKEFGITQPAAILDKTTEIVIEYFSKSEEDIKDGMDISLCAYNPKTKTMQWAGANNPLWLVQNGEIIETKADKQPIGMDEDSKPFTNHIFNLNVTDTIYLFTDGYADQFGGESGQKKLTKKRFKDLLLTIQNKTLQEQGIILEKFITDYRKEIEQIDDILVMGVKI